jgi:hypothetical protein
MILELIPILSFFFLLTSTAGSALWAARIEEERKRTGIDSLIAQEEVPTQGPPEYSDDIA